MMRNILAMLLQWWAFFFAGIFAVGVCIYLAHKAVGKLKKLLRRTAVAVVAFLAVIYGGAKNIGNRFSADDGLTLVSATMNVATNETDRTTLEIKWLGPDEGQPIYVREKTTDRWKSIDEADENWLFDERTYANGTNTVNLFMNPGVAASNASIYAMWHLGGNNLPPVEILDGDGISVLSYGATAHHVTIQYGVNPSVLGDIMNHAVIEKAEADGAWAEVWRDVVMPSVTNNWTNTVEFAGFWVGRTTRWRARLEVVTP